MKTPLVRCALRDVAEHVSAFFFRPNLMEGGSTSTGTDAATAQAHMDFSYDVDSDGMEEHDFDGEDAGIGEEEANEELQAEMAKGWSISIIF